MANLIERTMISAGEIGGVPKRAGQIVTLDPFQLKRAAAAGLVHEDEADNATVPKADLPATIGGAAAFEADIQEAAASASRQIEAIRARLAEAQATADGEIAGHRQRVTEAGEQADRDILALRQRVSDADNEMATYRQSLADERTRLDAEIAARRAAASETPPADDGQEKPPEGTSEPEDKPKGRTRG